MYGNCDIKYTTQQENENTDFILETPKDKIYQTPIRAHLPQKQNLWDEIRYLHVEKALVVNLTPKTKCLGTTVIDKDGALCCGVMSIIQSAFKHICTIHLRQGAIHFHVYQTSDDSAFALY